LFDSVILFGTKPALDRRISRRNLIQNQCLAGKYRNDCGGNIRAFLEQGQEPMPGKILVVDDHAPNRELIREALTDSAYEISEAGTALANSLASGNNAGFNPLYQIGGPRSIQLALKLQF
jgi:PleD family two-component response regulator